MGVIEDVVKLPKQVCTCCGKRKSRKSFYTKKQSNELRPWCIKCTSNNSKLFRQSKIGLLHLRYLSQKANSKSRGHKLPKYTLEEFKVWALSQDVYHNFYANWKLSGFKKELAPSFDRLNDLKRYSLKRLQIVTWETNQKLFDERRLSGVDVRNADSVIGISKATGEKFKFYSMNQATRETGVDSGEISKCCNKKDNRKSAGGFIWKFKKK